MGVSLGPPFLEVEGEQGSVVPYTGDCCSSHMKGNQIKIFSVMIIFFSLDSPGQLCGLGLPPS